MNASPLPSDLAATEEAVADLYLGLAARFPDQPPAPLWQELAGEVRSHAAALRGEDLSRIPPTQGDPLFLAVARNELARLLELARNGRITPESALSLSYGVACSLVEKHRAILPDLPPALESLRLDLARAHLRHAMRMREVAPALGLEFPELAEEDHP